MAVDGARPDRNPALAERARILDILGVDVRLGAEHVAVCRTAWPPTSSSPPRGWRPDQPLLVGRPQAGVPVWGEVELAWRMRAAVGPGALAHRHRHQRQDHDGEMLASILRAAGLRAIAAGNVGTPILDAVLHPEPYDVIAVELSSFQLHWSDSLAPYASACLNVAPDHVDWHGSFEAYAAAKGKVYARTKVACVYNVQDPATERLVMDADVQEGCRAIGFTLGTPAPSMLGVVDDILADRAFVEQRRPPPPSSPPSTTSAATAATLAPHNVANALAAAALARAYGVPAGAPSATGCARFRPEPHRIADCGEVDGVRYVDDSKATNPHAAPASLLVLRARRLGRGRPAQGRRRRRARPRGRAPAARGRPDRRRPGDRSRRRWPDTRRMSPWSTCRARTLGSWMSSSSTPPAWPEPVTSCCSRPPRRRWTCSPTTAPAATPSPPRCPARGRTAGDGPGPAAQGEQP